jgi:hypothetical protein
MKSVPSLLLLLLLAPAAASASDTYGGLVKTTFNF